MELSVACPEAQELYVGRAVDVREQATGHFGFLRESTHEGITVLKSHLEC